MSLDDEKYNKKININADAEETEGESGSGESGAGGKSGQIEFRDFLAGGERLRDDLLSPEERKRLLAVHKDTTVSNIQKQKERKEQYKALKEGKVTVAAHRAGMAAVGANPQYKTNPVLANKAQFSGTDRQINALPTENMAETNNEKRQELQFQYNLRHRPEYAHTPKFNPKPAGPNR